MVVHTHLLCNDNLLLTGQVEIGILRTGVAVNSFSTVHYLNGNCTLTITLTSGPLQAMGTSEGPELLLFETDRFTFQCEVNGSVQLSGFATVYGESNLTICHVYMVKECSFTFFPKSKFFPETFVILIF